MSSVTRRIRAVGAALLVVGLAMGAAASEPAAETKSPVVYVAPDDADMAEAVAAARGTLDSVLERVATGGIPMEAIQLKVAIPKEGGGHENLFVEGIVRLDETTFEGLLANEPRALPGLKRGDRHRFTHDEITDWLFIANGRMHGAYTLRVMLPLLPKQQADEFRAMLAPLP